MITGFIVLLVCQLIGDFTVHALDVPIPGPVVGMVLLLLVLRLRRPGRDSGVVRAADGLLRHLQLLFIPAGVGIIQYLPVLAGAWLPVIAGLVISWLAVLLVTAGTGVGTLHLEALLKRRGELDGAQYISFLLGPATVALALPLCRQAANIRRAAWAVIACLIAGSITAVVVAITVTKLLGGSDQLALSLAPKSTTTPVAIALSESVGGIASLTAAFTVLTGILGAVAAPRLLFATLPWMLNLSP